MHKRPEPVRVRVDAELAPVTGPAPETDRRDVSPALLGVTIAVVFALFWLLSGCHEPARPCTGYVRGPRQLCRVDGP